MAENSQQHNSHSNGGSASNHQNHTATDNSAALMQLESLERMMKFPVVEAAWHQGQDVYGKVKGKSIHAQLLLSYITH